MSATIPNEMKLKELLKSTGYDCPEDMQDKTFTEATSGSGPAPSGSSFCQFKAQYGGRGYISGISFSHDDVTTIHIVSLEQPDGYDLVPDTGAHLVMVSEQVTGVKLTLADGSTVDGVELT